MSISGQEQTTETASLDRRITPHYSCHKATKIFYRINNAKQSVDVVIINLSKSGALISCQTQLSPESALNVDLPQFKSSLPQISVPAYVHTERKNNTTFIYSLVFKPSPETAQSLSLYLQHLLPIPERRGKERRKAPRTVAKENRFRERRTSKLLFLPCLRFSRLTKAIEANQYFYFRELEDGLLPVTRIKGREIILLGSNSYLGLSTHQKVKDAAKAAIDKYGTGTGGSRLLNGNFDIHEQLEQTISKYMKTEDCLVFSTGYQTNIGLISGLLDKESVAIVDEKIHASIIDGCLLGQVTILPFRHNDMRSLEKKLQKWISHQKKIVITEGVFGMHGDTAKLKDICLLTEKYNTALMVDDAHGIGVLGEHGRGTLEHYGVEGKADLITGTFSKTLAGIGGFVAGNKDIINYLKHHSRSMIFSAALTPAICAATIAAFEVIEMEPDLRQNLWRNINFLKKNLAELGYKIGESESAIIPIHIGDERLTFQITGLLQDLGVFVNPIIYPAVRKRESRIRVSPMATHTIDQLGTAVEAFKKAGKQLRII